MVERIARRCGDSAVGRDFSFGNGADDAAEGVVSRLIFAEGVLQDSSLEILRRDWASHGEDFIRVGLQRTYFQEMHDLIMCDGYATVKAISVTGMRFSQ